MKLKYIGMGLCAILAFFTARLEAQTPVEIKIDAVVQTAEGLPVAGAIVQSKEKDSQSITDVTGEFSIRAPLNSTLKVHATGFREQFAEVTPELSEIILLPESEEMVNIAFREMAETDLIGGVSYINMPEILEKNYTTYSLSDLSAYVGGYNGNLWGMDNYLLLVDGVPRDAGDVQPTEIEQISFLKGVNAVTLYGSRAAKGVVLITTKRGDIEEKAIKVRANTGFNVPISYPKYLGSAEYMTLYNEARRNDGLTELYSDEEIWHYASGENPYRYPDVDYYSSEFLKDVTNRTDVTTEIYGGNENARFYTNIGFVTAGSLLDFGEAKDAGTNRLNLRGNVDVDINDFITSSINAAAVFYDSKGAVGDYFGEAATLRPNRFAPLIPISSIEDGDESSLLLVENSNHIIDGKYLLGGNQLHQTNPIADIYAGGSSKFTSRQFMFDAGLNFNLNGLLEGLSFQTQFGVDYSASYVQSYNNEYAVYEANWNNYSGSDLIGSIDKFGEDVKDGVENISGSWYDQTLAFSGQFNYNRTLDDTHNISAMLIASGYQQSETEVYHKVSNANLGLHAGYSFLDKYYFEFNGAMAQSAKLPDGNRTAFSPTASLGWRLSEEDFLSEFSFIDDLKLTASAGIIHTDLDINDYYLYKAIYTQTDGSWYSWRDDPASQTTDSRSGENPDLSFAKRKEISLGIEASMLRNSLQMNVSLFANKMKGLITQAASEYPSYFTTYWPVSSFIPYINYNDDERLGFDFNVKYNKRIGEIDWQIGVAGTYYETKAAKRDEIYKYDYQRREGRPLDALFGLENDGFFMSEEDIANSPDQMFGEVKPGDIKYVDQNGDGVIDDRDEVYLGRGGWSGAPFTLGVNITAKWKNLTFFMLGTGGFGAYSMKNSSYFWVDGDDKYSEVVRDRWTEATKNTATYPRLSSQTNDNNFRSSDFWMYSTDRFNLSKVQVTYSFPERFFNTSFINGLDIYASGSNLLTISPEREIMNLNIGSSPQTRFYNAGVKVVF